MELLHLEGLSTSVQIVIAAKSLQNGGGIHSTRQKTAFK
jgi:hypothetical protein